MYTFNEQQLFMRITFLISLFTPQSDVLKFNKCHSKWFKIPNKATLLLASIDSKFIFSQNIYLPLFCEFDCFEIVVYWYNQVVRFLLELLKNVFVLHRLLPPRCIKFNSIIIKPKLEKHKSKFIFVEMMSFPRRQSQQRCTKPIHKKSHPFLDRDKNRLKNCENKFAERPHPVRISTPPVRACPSHSPDAAQISRRHDHNNLLSLSGIVSDDSSMPLEIISGHSSPSDYHPQKPEWDHTLTDMSRYRTTRKKLLERKMERMSKHHEMAAAELQYRDRQREARRLSNSTRPKAKNSSPVFNPPIRVGRPRFQDPKPLFIETPQEEIKKERRPRPPGHIVPPKNSRPTPNKENVSKIHNQKNNNVLENRRRPPGYAKTLDDEIRELNQKRGQNQSPKVEFGIGMSPPRNQRPMLRTKQEIERRGYHQYLNVKFFKKCFQNFKF